MFYVLLHPSLLRRFGFPVAFFALRLALSRGTAVAQYNTAEIEGVAKDGQGGGVAGASIVAARVGSGLKIERVSDSAGRFFLPALPVGEYVVAVELAGFRRFTQTGLTLKVGQRIELSVTLQIGELTDAVTVTGEAPLLHVANAEIFNLMNHTNFDVPNRIAFTSNFGRIFSAKPPRQMQFGLKFLF